MGGESDVMQRRQAGFRRKRGQRGEIRNGGVQGDRVAVTLHRLRDAAGDGHAGVGGVQRRLHWPAGWGGWRLQRVQRAGLGRDGEGQAVHHGVRGQVDGCSSRGRGAQGLELDGRDMAGAVVPVGQDAVINTQVVDGEFGHTALTGGGRWLRGGGGCRGTCELPVGGARGGAFEQNVGMDEDQPADLNPAPKQRQQAELNIDRLDAGHVGAGEAGRIGQGGVAHLDGGMEGEFQANRPVQRQGAAGGGLHGGGDPRLVAVGAKGRDEDDDRRHENADQHDDSAQDPAKPTASAPRSVDQEETLNSVGSTSVGRLRRWSGKAQSVEGLRHVGRQGGFRDQRSAIGVRQA